MSRVPPTFKNGDSDPHIPEDLVWDPDNHPIVFNCTQHTEHHPRCDGSCGEFELESESMVELFNEGRRYARAGMSFQGVPAAYQGVIPVPGINVDLVDLLMWLEATKQLLIDKLGVSQSELDEVYREKKVNFLREIREANEANIRSARLRQQLEISQPGLLGPDGRPIG